MTEDEIKTIIPDDALKANVVPAITILRTYFVERVLLTSLEEGAI